MISLHSHSTVYDGLLGIRKHLATSLKRESQTITDIEDILDPDQDASSLNNVACTFSDGLRNLIQSIRYNKTSQVLTYAVEDVDTGIITTTDYALSQVREGDVNDLLNGVDSLVVNSDTNDAIASINDMFLLHPKVNISVITSSLQDYANTNVKEYGTIVSTLSALTDALGNISQMSWVQWCKRVFNVGLRAGDRQSFQLDDTNPYKVISFINIMATVFGMVASMIFSAISSAFTGLVALVAIVISSIINIWNSARQTFGEVRIDDEQLLWHLAGSTFSSILRPGYHDATNFPDLCHYISLAGLDVYWWVDSSEAAGTLKYQCFVNINVHPDRLYNYLLLTTGSAETANYININSQHFMREDHIQDAPEDQDVYDAYIDMFMTEDEYSLLSTDGDFLRRAVAANLCCIGLQCAYFGQWQCGGGVSTYSPQIDDSFMEYQSASFMANIAAIAFAEFKYKLNIDAAYKMFDKLTWQDCFKIHNWLFQQTNKTYYNWIREEYENVNDAGQAVGAYAYKSPLHGLFVLSAGSQYDIMVYTNVESDAGNSLDNFPVSPKIILPQLDFDAILKWMIIAGVIATAAFITTRLLIRNRRIARTVKRQRSAEALQRKYDQAVSSGDPSDMQAYIKAKKRFDLKSKIFHWDSYDPQNQWWEPRAVASNMGALLTVSTARTIGLGIAGVASSASGIDTTVTSIKNSTKNLPQDFANVVSAVGSSTSTITGALSTTEQSLKADIDALDDKVDAVSDKADDIETLITGQ